MVIVKKHNKVILIAHTALFFVALIWAANYTIAKIAMPEYIRPYGFVALRVLVASVVFVAIHALFVREKVEGLRDHATLMLCSLFGITINKLLFFKGLSMTSPINASLVMTMTPILVLTISVLFKSEKLTLSKATGICVASLGVFMLIFSGRQIHTVADLGAVLLLINSISYGIHLIILKPLAQKYHTITIMMWSFIYGVIFIVPIGYEELVGVDWASIPTDAWLSILFVVLAATLGTYFLTMWAISFVNASAVGVYSYVQPVLATLIAMAVGSDILTPQKSLFGVIILFGVYLVSKKESDAVKDRHVADTGK